MRRYVMTLGCGCVYIVRSAPRVTDTFVCDKQSNGKPRHGMTSVVCAETHDHYVSRREVTAAIAETAAAS